MDAMEKRVLRRKSGIVAEVVDLTDVLAQDAMRQGILRERDFAKVMTRARNRERVLLFLEYLEKVRPAAFEKLCYFLENHGYSWLCDELLVELICEKGHLQIDATVLVEARAIVRQRLGEKRRLDEEDIEELISLIATRYQIAKETAARQKRRPKRQKAIDVKSVKENVKDLCDELERCMLLSRGPSRIESSRFDGRAPPAAGKPISPFPSPRPHSSIAPDLKSEHGKGIDSWVHSLKQKLNKLTSAYRQAAAVIEDETSTEAGTSYLSSPTVTSLGEIEIVQEQRNSQSRKSTKVRFEKDKTSKDKRGMLQRQKSAVAAPSSASSGGGSAKSRGFFGKSSLGKPPPPPSLGAKPPKHEAPSSKSAKSKDSKSSKAKSTKSTSSKDSAEQNSNKLHKLSSKGSKHDVVEADDTGHRAGDEAEHLPDLGQAQQDEGKAQGRRRGVRGQRSLRGDGENGEETGSESSYSQIPSTGSAKERHMDEIRREQRQLLKHRRHIMNMRRIMSGSGDREGANISGVEEQYWQKRYDTMKKSQSVGYYFFLSEKRRDRCGACHSACSTRNPSKWDCAWWFKDPKSRQHTRSRTEINLYDSTFGLDLDSDDASLFDDEECPGAVPIPGTRRRRCLACAYANKELPEFFDACVSPHGGHHFHFPQIGSGDKPRSGRERSVTSAASAKNNANVVVVN